MGDPNNLVVLRGTISNEPTARTLPAGVEVVQFDLATVVDVDGTATNLSVPLSWTDPSPREVASARIGASVLVVGSVRRRFFRSGGATQSRTEVIIDTLVPTRRTKSARSLAAAAAESITRGCG